MVDEISQEKDILLPKFGGIMSFSQFRVRTQGLVEVSFNSKKFQKRNFQNSPALRMFSA